LKWEIKQNISPTAIAVIKPVMKRFLFLDSLNIPASPVPPCVSYQTRQSVLSFYYLW
jgi:hypothetical protein